MGRTRQFLSARWHQLGQLGLELRLPALLPHTSGNSIQLDPSLHLAFRPAAASSGGLAFLATWPLCCGALPSPPTRVPREKLRSFLRLTLEVAKSHQLCVGLARKGPKASPDFSGEGTLHRSTQGTACMAGRNRRNGYLWRLAAAWATQDRGVWVGFPGGPPLQSL